MGKSGFTIIESNIVGVALNSLTDMIADFSLPDEWPDNIQTFLQISLSLSESSKVFIRRNGTNYLINNNTAVVGEVYRSIPIQKGEVINIQLDTTQTDLQFKFSLEE